MTQAADKLVPAGWALPTEVRAALEHAASECGLTVEQAFVELVEREWPTFVADALATDLAGMSVSTSDQGGGPP